MKKNYLLRSITLIGIISCFCCTDTYAQKVKKGKLNLAADTLDANAAWSRKTNYKKTFESKGRKKVTTSVTFDVETLRDILDSYAAKGVKEIKFQFAIMRQEDVPKYVAKHPELALTQDQQDDLVDRPTLLIKVPRTVVNDLNATSSSSSSSFFSTSSSMAMAAAESASYIDVGTICPPPAQCDEEDSIQQ